MADLLQRLQRWYIINCDGDWEHEHGISITNVGNPGWWVTIDLQDTCLAKAIKHRDSAHSIKRSSIDWLMCYVEDQQFIGSGGPNNLSEILIYFLDTFLPENIDPECTYDVLLPLLGYEHRIWLKAEARMLSESVLKLVSIGDNQQEQFYEASTDADYNAFETLVGTGSLSDLRVAYNVGDTVEPYTLGLEANSLYTFLVAPIKR
ncbi:immunity 53 family protein [Hymenobacter pini]|uniref:immunity 53 family protein n=1 Tax=Hymenobacter pini TaxID=2880879 RepID=UPI001CF2A6CE|nr:immunity 53 family protein [Hymenobacter pini]MCA8829246.1 immunity 53 family protein [Hymenobacter pini]